MNDERPPGKPPRVSASEMTEIVMPENTNVMGNLMGGRLMYLMDMAASLAALRHSRQVVVTASVDRVDFLRPVRVGQAVILRAAVVYTGTSSMYIRVEVEAESLIKGEKHHVSTAYFTFVALDKEGHPTPVPPVLPETEAEWKLYREAEGRPGKGKPS